MDSQTCKRLEEIVKYASMAPSFRNSQPWRFSLGGSYVRIHPDYSRHLTVVDPDYRKFYMSLGCALENLRIALDYHGFGPQIHLCLNADSEEYLEASFHGGSKGKDSSLFQAIPKRVGFRGTYDEQALSGGELETLTHSPLEDGVSMHWITDPEQLLPLQKSNDSWPRWVPEFLFKHSEGTQKFSREDAKNLHSSLGVVVFSSNLDSKTNWVKAGSSFERFVLLLGTLGFQYTHFNQLTENPVLRKTLQQRLGLNEELPLIAIGFGHGKAEGSHMRRPVEDLLIETMDTLFARPGQGEEE